MSKPFVIITIGPTGAGKSGLLTETIKHCKLEDLRSEHIFRVDDLVTAKKSYKEAVDETIQEIEPAFQSIPLNTKSIPLNRKYASRGLENGIRKRRNSRFSYRFSYRFSVRSSCYRIYGKHGRSLHGFKKKKRL